MSKLSYAWPDPQLTSATLSAAGYRHEEEWDGWYWHKWMRDSTGRKTYQISFREYGVPPQVPQVHYQPKVQFMSEYGECFNVSYLVNLDTTVADVEGFYGRVFSNMNCRNYG